MASAEANERIACLAFAKPVTVVTRDLILSAECFLKIL
jgi:hypothetical protein